MHPWKDCHAYLHIGWARDPLLHLASWYPRAPTLFQWENAFFYDLLLRLCSFSLSAMQILCGESWITRYQVSKVSSFDAKIGTTLLGVYQAQSAWEGETCNQHAWKSRHQKSRFYPSTMFSSLVKKPTKRILPFKGDIFFCSLDFSKNTVNHSFSPIEREVEGWNFVFLHRGKIPRRHICKINAR